MRLKKSSASSATIDEGVITVVVLFISYVAFFIMLVLFIRPALSLGTNFGMLVAEERVPRALDPVRGEWIRVSDTEIATTYASVFALAPVPVSKMTGVKNKYLAYATFGEVWVTTPITAGERALSVPSARILRREGFYPYQENSSTAFDYSYEE